MDMKTLQIRRMHYPGSDPKGDYGVVRINGIMYRTDNLELISNECEKFLAQHNEGLDNEAQE